MEDERLRRACWRMRVLHTQCAASTGRAALIAQPSSLAVVPCLSLRSIRFPRATKKRAASRHPRTRQQSREERGDIEEEEDPKKIKEDNKRQKRRARQKEDYLEAKKKQLGRLYPVWRRVSRTQGYKRAREMYERMMELEFVDKDRLQRKAATITLKTAAYSVLAHRSLLLLPGDGKKGAHVFLKRVVKDIAKKIGRGVTVELSLQYLSANFAAGLVVGQSLKRLWKLRKMSKRAKQTGWRRESIRMVLKYTAGKGLETLIPSALLASPVRGILYFVIDAFISPAAGEDDKAKTDELVPSAL